MVFLIFISMRECAQYRWRKLNIFYDEVKLYHFAWCQYDICTDLVVTSKWLITTFCRSRPHPYFLQLPNPPPSSVDFWTIPLLRLYSFISNNIYKATTICEALWQALWIQWQHTIKERDRPLPLDSLPIGSKDRQENGQTHWSVTSPGDSHLQQEQVQPDSRRSLSSISNVLHPLTPLSSPSFLSQSQRAFCSPWG